MYSRKPTHSYPPYRTNRWENARVYILVVVAIVAIAVAGGFAGYLLGRASVYQEQARIATPTPNALVRSGQNGPATRPSVVTVAVTPTRSPAPTMTSMPTPTLVPTFTPAPISVRERYLQLRDGREYHALLSAVAIEEDVFLLYGEFMDTESEATFEGVFWVDPTIGDTCDLETFQTYLDGYYGASGVAEVTISYPMEGSFFVNSDSADIWTCATRLN